MDIKKNFVLSCALTATAFSMAALLIIGIPGRQRVRPAIRAILCDHFVSYFRITFVTRFLRLLLAQSRSFADV